MCGSSAPPGALRSCGLFGLAVAASYAFPGQAKAQDDAATTDSPPADCPDRSFDYVRSEETLAAYKDRRCDRDAFDRLRYIDLSGDGNTVLSLGGELRVRYELFSETDFGDSRPDSDGSYQGRAYAIAELRHGDLFRGVVNVRYAEQIDIEAGQIAPIDAGGLDLQEAFAEIGSPESVSLRIGRQEISYPLAPPSRLLSARNGPNVRRNWDAIRLISHIGDWRTDSFYAQLVNIEDGDFDDSSNADTELWGAYAFGPAPWADGEDGDQLNLYYYGLNDVEPSFQGGSSQDGSLQGGSLQGGSGAETRHTFGARYVTDAGGEGFDLDAEGAWQVGDIGEADISAGFAAADFGWTTATDWSLRLGGQLFASTGDSDPDDGEVGTFNELFPSGAYLNDAALLRGQNILSASPRLSMRPTDRISLRAFYTHYWRSEGNDGLYAQSGRLQRAGTPDDSREIGGYLGARGSYGINHRTTFRVQAGRFFAGRFLQDTGSAEDTTFLRIDLEFQI